MNPLLRIRELTVGFEGPRGKNTVLDGVSLDMNPGEVVVLTGETGCGKSVLARTLIGLPGDHARVQGSIRFKGRELTTLGESRFSRIRGRSMAMILQNPQLALNPVLPVGRQLVEPLRRHTGMDRHAAGKRVREGLKKMGFERGEEIFHRYPFQLSGGMLQRILIISAMILKPELLIADEPARALDDSLRNSVHRWLAESRDRWNAAVLLITHDLDLAAKLASRVAVMVAGQLVEINTATGFLTGPLHPYSQSLVRSYFNLPWEGPADALSPLSRSATGCRYISRCDRKTPRCLEKKPEMIPCGKGAKVRCHHCPME